MSNLSSSFRITLGVAPDDSGFVLRKELQMLKIALLYADETTLCSLKTSFLLALVTIANFSKSDRWSFLEAVAPTLSSNPVEVSNLLSALDLFKKLRTVKHPPTPIFQQRLKVEKALEQTWTQLQDQTMRTLETAEFPSLMRALESNMLKIHPFNYSSTTKDAVNEYIKVLGSSLTGSESFPMFDDFTSEILAAGIAEKKFDVDLVSAERSKNPALATVLFDRLPLFEEATLDEILDIRSELSRHLASFRGSVMNLSTGIDSLPWDGSFKAEADELYHREVAPAVHELEEEVRTQTYLRALTERGLKDMKTVGISPVIGMAYSTVTDFPAILSAALGLAGGVALTAAQAYRNWRERVEVIKQKGMYFYYKTGTSLQKE